MRRLAVVAVVALAAAGGCGKKAVEDKVVMVADDDPAMAGAVQKARATVGTFTAALRAPKPGQSGFSVKLAIVDGSQTEHMWLAPVRFDGRTFHGTINNDAELVSNVKIGDKRSVEPGQISDWMYIDNGKLKGGYSIRVLRDKLPPDERARFDTQVPFTFD